MSLANSLRHGLAALAVGAIAALAAVGAEAHPGHDSVASGSQLSLREGLEHLLTEPDHLGAFVLVIALAWVGARWLRRMRRDSRPDMRRSRSTRRP